MNLNADFAEQVQVVSAIVPVDLQTGANNGDWVSMKNYERCTLIVFKAAGTAGDDPTVTLEQATAVAGTSAKNLVAIDRVHVKQDTALTGVGQYTLVEQTAAATYTDATSAEDQAIWVIDIQAEDLDRENGFDCIRASIADVGSNAQIGCALMLLWGARYGGELPSAIAD